MIDLMERNREGRRGGNGSGNVSSSRRPRTFGFRDASEDESQNSRFHSKKESHGSRKRKKCRSSNGEYHFGHCEERDENYEDATVMAASEEDDDLPPPTVGRQAGKLKIHLKNTHEEVKPIVVPRKLRTAMLKRYNESTLKSLNESRGKLNIEFAVAKATTTCSGAALKPAEDMKTNNHKIHSNKHPKVSSSTISEQEAEVAETLFDLARMFSSQSTNSETKSQSNSEMKMGPNPTTSPLSSVQHCSSPVATMAGSPSSSHNISALGASKRKHHDVYNSKDAGEVAGDAQYTLTAKRCLSASSLGIAADSVDAEQLTNTSPFQTEVCTGPPAEPLSFSMVSSIAISPSTSANASLTPTQMLQTANCPKIEEKTFQQEESDNHTFIQKVPSTYNVLENKGSVTNINDVKSKPEKDIKTVGNSVEKETPTKLEAENGLVQLPLAKNNCPSKSEIDLMTPPKPGDEINDIMNMKKLDIKEKQEVDIEGYEQKHKTMNYQTSEQENQMAVKIEQDVCKYQESRKANEHMKDASDQSNCLDTSKQDVDKESPRGTGKNVKADRVQRGDRSASATTSMPIAVTGVTGPTLPLSMGLSGWSAGLPPLGYYSPVAAAAAAAAAAGWPSSLSLTGTSPVDENIKLPSPLFLQTRHSWKRSATHVYITHFIVSQQQLRKNPLWAAAFAANTYNLSIPMAPGGLLGSALGPEVRGSGSGAGTVNGRGYAMSAVAKDKSSGPYVDVVGRKSLSQQQTQTAQQQLSLFSQAGSSNVFPVTQSASTSTAGSDAGRVNVGVGETMLSNGNSAMFSSSSVHVASLDTENGTSNKAVASAASVQAQLLHSVIQRNVFPYSFSHQQFGPLFSGHPSPQQVAQYYSNPFFGSHLLQPLTPAQQSQSLSNLMSETTVTQKQQFSQGCNFAASGPLQQASIIAEASSVDQISKKERITVSGIPTAEVKAIPSRSVYGQTSSSVIFPPPVLAVGMGTFPSESQDISKTFVGKQESKMHQHSQTQLQSQYQATLKWQQQQDIDTVNCVTSPAMNLKSPNPYASEPMSPSSIVKNQGPDSHPAVTLVMASQGHTVLQTADDSMIGLVHYPTAADKSLVSGQSYNFSISEGQKQQQQHRTQRQRLVSIGIEDDKANIEECSFSNSGCKEDRKSSCKLQPNQTNMPRVDLEESLTKNASAPSSTADSHKNMAAPSFQGAASNYYSVCAPNHQFTQGSKQKIVHQKPASSSSILTAPTTVDSSMVTFSEKSHSYPPTLNKMPQQISSFLGHAVSTPNQVVRRGGTLQEHEIFSQRSSAGSPGPATSGCTIPPTIPSMERAPGKMPRNHQSTTNVIPSRLPPDSSISSSGVMPLSPLSPVPSGALTAKSAVSMKDSLSPKSSSGSNSGKKTSMPFQMNGTTMLGSNCLAQNAPLKPSQSQLVQNQYDINQHMPYPFFQQPAQPMEPVQKQSTVPQQYHLSTNQQQAVQLQKQSLTPQQNIQLRQQLFIQQNPQYFHTQSHQRLEISSQPQTTLSQQAARQMKPQSGQMVCHSQQHGNISEQQMLGVSATSFGIATTGDMPADLCMGTSGDISLTGMSDGAALPRGTAAGSLTPAKLTTDINKSSSFFQKANGTGPTFLPSQCGPLNCVASTQQQINTNCTISSPYPNLLSQATSIAESTQKSGDDKPAKSN